MRLQWDHYKTNNICSFCPPMESDAALASHRMYADRDLNHPTTSLCGLVSGSTKQITAPTLLLYLFHYSLSLRPNSLCILL